MSKKTTQNQATVVLTIDKIVHGGAGLARHAGKACFVEYVLPGETVRAAIVERKSQFFRAELHEVLVPSPARVEPACALYRRCGGCQWQHMSYAMQLACKKAIVADCLKRIGKLQDLQVSDPIASPLPTRYRCRADFKIAPSNPPEIGFFQRQSHRVIAADECLLLEPGLLTALTLCREHLKNQNASNAAYTDLRLVAAGETMVLGRWHDRAGRRHKNFSADLVRRALLYSKQTGYEEISGIRFLRDTEGFYQVNRLQNARMIEYVCRSLGPVRNGALLDLFCGSGNFSLFLARAGWPVIGIDSSSAAILEARENARINGIETARFKTADIYRLGQQDLESNFAAIVLDPPRSGCEPETLKGIIGTRPEHIVYVSCDSATLARDLGFLANSGYVIQSVQPFDMFPQTSHIETIVVLKKAG